MYRNLYEIFKLNLIKFGMDRKKKLKQEKNTRLNTTIKVRFKNLNVTFLS